jgi:meiotic recombination protein SPO11
MYAFVDLDPDGIAILSTYKYGSHRLAHEGTSLNDTLTLSLPDLYWLGVKSHQMSRASLGDSSVYTNAMPELQGAMKLTARDRTKALQMLQWNLCAEGGPEKEWRKELQTMLMLNVKAEMQILDELPYGMVAWISSELERAAEPRIELLQDNALPDDVGLDDGLLF